MTTRLSTIPGPDNVPEEFSACLLALKRNVEVLAGLDHSADKTDQAIRYGEANVAHLDPLTSGAAAGATPTKAEFDKAIADITAIYKRVDYMISLLRGDPVGA